MGPPPQSAASQQRESSPMDLVIRVALIGGLAVLCYQVISPFLMLAVWSIILAVTLYLLHRWVARKLGGKQGLTATLLVVVGVVLIVVPTALLMSSVADSIRGAIASVPNNTVTIPPPRESVQEWPIVGKKIYGVWSLAHDDLPSLVQSLQPKIGELARRALAMIASIGGGILLFLASFIVAGILMAYGEAGAGASRAIFRRVAGPVKGDQFTKLSTATIRTVAQGVVGV